MTRRNFGGAAPAVAAYGRLKIEYLEIWRLEGAFAGQVGSNRQHQVRPESINDRA